MVENGVVKMRRRDREERARQNTWEGPERILRALVQTDTQQQRRKTTSHTFKKGFHEELRLDEELSEIGQMVRL